MARKHSPSKQQTSELAYHHLQKNNKRNLAWLWVPLGVLLVAGLGILFIGPKNNPSAQITPAQANTTPIEITPAQAYAKYQQGVFFLDVRTQDEWNQFHITRSTLIPLDQLQSRLSELSKDQEIVVICLSGHRSQSGVTTLQQAGFRHVSYLGGGLQAWLAAGYPVNAATP